MSKVNSTAARTAPTMATIIMGPPGSGKTTYAKGLPHDIFISCGDLFRSTDKRGILGARGKKRRGKWFTSLHTMIKSKLSEQLADVSTDKNVVIEGMWIQNLPDLAMIFPIKQIVYLRCSKELAKSRMLTRSRSDEDTNRIIGRLAKYYAREPELLKELQTTWKPTFVDQ